jgi:NAD(P)-dependent dehydrogenase (short-subunit alcohol dehydrogenase family)
MSFTKYQFLLTTVLMVMFGFLPGPSVALAVLGRKSTAQQVLSHLNQNNQLAPYALKGGTVIVTGGNSGIGAETVRVLAQTAGEGMKVVLCARNVQAAQAVIDESTSLLPEQKKRVHVEYLDLSDLKSVRTAAKAIINKFEGVDCIVNNAGIMSLPNRETTVDGIEMQFGTNHVGHHYLTRLLLPHLNENGRVVTVASTAHQYALVKNSGEGRVDWQSERKYTSFRAYGISKLANILFAKSLQEFMNVEYPGRNLSSVSLHPGVIASPLWKHTLPRMLLPAVRLIANKSIEQGAATNVYCALARYVEGGGYYDDCSIGRPNAAAIDPQNRVDLWEYTESLLGEKGFDLASPIPAFQQNIEISQSV